MKFATEQVKSWVAMLLQGFKNKICGRQDGMWLTYPSHLKFSVKKKKEIRIKHKVQALEL